MASKAAFCVVSFTGYAVTELGLRATIPAVRRNSMSAVNPLPVAQAVAAPVGTLPIAPVVAVAAAQPAYVQAPLGGVTQGGDVFNGDYRAIVGTWEVEFLVSICGCCPLGPYTSQSSYDPSISTLTWRDPNGFVTTDRWTSPTTFETTSNNPRGIQHGKTTFDPSRGVMDSESYAGGQRMVTRMTKISTDVVSLK